jgi:hypothetical protein
LVEQDQVEIAILHDYYREHVGSPIDVRAHKVSSLFLLFLHEGKDNKKMMLPFTAGT